MFIVAGTSSDRMLPLDGLRSRTGPMPRGIMRLGRDGVESGAVVLRPVPGLYGGGGGLGDEATNQEAS